MSDLTLREALEEYEAECREVLGHDYHESFDTVAVNWCQGEQQMIRELIGACTMWMNGKAILCIDGLAVYTDRDGSVGGGYWPDDPLRFALEEVRANIKAGRI